MRTERARARRPRGRGLPDEPERWTPCGWPTRWRPTPILVAREPGDEASLEAAIDVVQRRGRAFLADPILDPIPFGLAAIDRAL